MKFTQSLSRAFGWVFAFGAAGALRGNPGGMTVVSGTATSQNTGSQLTVTTGPLTILNWNNFNIQRGQSTTFVQPSAGSVVFNEIGGASPSKIFGSLNANGTVILANANGFYFGPNSFVNVGGDFIATTAPLPPNPGLAGSWDFTGMPPLAGIVNYGQITVGQGKSLYLLAENIDNHGSLTAPGGTVGLDGGQDVLLSDRADGRGLSARVKAPSGVIDNEGNITADAGAIALNAQVVNQNGVIQANSVREENGTIELVAGDQLNLGANSQISASGDVSAKGSAGGSVTLKSGGAFSDAAGSQIAVRGGANGGNGGKIEVSAADVLSLNSTMSAAAQSGYSAGRLLLDPANITLGTSGSGSAGDGEIGAGSGSGTLALNVNSAFAGGQFSSITLQATANITLAAGTVWNLSSTTGQKTGQLNLEAGGNIIFGNGAEILDPNNWSVNLQAGVNFKTGNVQSGVGSIYLNGGATGTLNGTVQTSAGNIDLIAGQNVLVGAGAVRTLGGGSISVDALSGNINAGTANGGYQFGVSGTTVSANLGGISTADGGNVTMRAGNNITSIPTVPSGQPPGASGAYGGRPGNVTLIAGNEVLGNYLVADGTGTILAGVQEQNGHVTQVLDSGAAVGTPTSPVALSLISGAWNVWAANDIFIQEVRNPNGTFDNYNAPVPVGAFPGNTDGGAVPANSSFLFNYAPNAAANFWAGNAITLTGSDLPRDLGYNQNMPPVYPPILTLTAGAGGITLDNSIILYPSSQGALQITTTGGGDLSGAFQPLGLTGITMSDSGLPGYASFANGHAVIPLHLDDPNPVVVDVSGNVNSFGLTVPTFADVAVAGSTYNFGFQGQNLSPAQTTTVTVGGDLTYRSDVTSVALTTPLPTALFNTVLSGNLGTAENLQYDAATATLSFHGVMSSAELAFLLNPYEYVLGPTGKPELGANGQPLTAPLTLTAAQQAAIQQLYTDSQTATLGSVAGLGISGPGKFDLTACSIDLGTSGGIAVLPSDSALAAVSPYGASLIIDTPGALNMTSSKIVNEGWQGSIQINVGTTLDVGDEFSAFGGAGVAKGIFTTSGGDIAVTAAGSIKVDGSRIATYNGGNINLLSLTGNVDAGAGGVGVVDVQGVRLNPLNGQLAAFDSWIPGSGILTAALPGSTATVGNITVAAPQGNISANAGGVVQLALNGDTAQNSTITLTAGHDITASGSGVIGENLDLKAGGSVNGILVSTGSIDVAAAVNANVTAFARGDVSITASGTVSGTVITSGAASVSGESITASLVSESATTTGNVSSGASIGVPKASVTKEEDAKVAEDASAAVAKSDAASMTDDENKKKAKQITLAQRSGRVTVLPHDKSSK